MAPTWRRKLRWPPPWRRKASRGPHAGSFGGPHGAGGGRSFGSFHGPRGSLSGGGWGGRAFGGLLDGFGGRGGWGGKGMRGVHSGVVPGRAGTRATVSTYSRGSAPLRGSAPAARGGWAAYGGKAILAGSVAAYGGWGAYRGGWGGVYGRDGWPGGWADYGGWGAWPGAWGWGGWPGGWDCLTADWRFVVRRPGSFGIGICGPAPWPAWYWRAAMGWRRPIRHTCIRFPPMNIHSMTMGILSMAMLNPLTP